MREQRLLIIISFLISMSLAPISGCSEPKMDEKEAQEVLNSFYTDKVPESINDRHLVRAGKAIVPYLVAEIQKRDMPKRRYAIGALGKIGDRRALPVLVKILGDRSELEYFRSDALRAIWHIDKKQGEELAKKYAGESIDIDTVSQLLREGKI